MMEDKGLTIDVYHLKNTKLLSITKKKFFQELFLSTSISKAVKSLGGQRSQRKALILLLLKKIS